MKVFFAWQSDHPRKICKNVITDALDAAITELAQEPGLLIPPDESREKIHLDHDTKGVKGSPEIVKTIFEKIDKARVFIGDLTIVGRNPDTIKGNETIPGRAFINPNVAIEYGYALHRLTDEGVLGVMNLHFGLPKELPFDIAGRRWPISYTLAPDAKAEDIKRAVAELTRRFVDVLREYRDAPKPTAQAFEEMPHGLGVPYFFNESETLGHCNQLDGDVEMPFREVLYMRLIPTITPKRLVAEEAMVKNAYRFGAMNSAGHRIPIVNKYGAMCFAPAGNTRNADALTQYFSKGEVWAINADIIRQGERYHPQIYNVLAAEDAFIHTLQNGLNYMREVAKIEGPIKAVAGIAGAKGRMLGVNGATIGQYGKLMENHIEHSMILMDDTEAAQDAFLIEFFEEIFDKAGHERPKHLNRYLVKDGNVR